MNMTWWNLIQTTAALVVLAEALAKIEQANPLEGMRGWLTVLWCIARPWVWQPPRVIVALKISGWMALSTASFMEIVQRLLIATPAWYEQLQLACALGGFALLIVRTHLRGRLTP
ncbi:hypothetical protein [Aquabacterium sp.]|uniref:hypothetical protein n=1 Tax=Aquabacterium sp. TaxID=1872578 RepID=UPI0025C5B3E7|nr:hypothetical protein [Aquabacterium sp.]